jgi:6-phosphogluconolactonase (cycloisomerase 2 family)
MHSVRRLTSISALAVALVGAFATPAFAHSSHDFRGDRAHESHARGDRYERGANHAVFVQTDNPAGNSVVAYHRSGDGTLEASNTYATGGLGGVLTGSVVDHLASQGSLTYDAQHALLFAVNAGSNTVSVFSVHGDRLHLTQVLPSYGDFPVSVAVHDGLVYVLNARSGGSVQGYGIFFGHVFPIAEANRSLGLNASATPEFVNTPGQVAFTPDGTQLIVTTKANGSSIDVFRIGRFGALSAPVVNAEPGTVPFAVTFDAARNLVVSEAGTNALATFAVHHDGTLTLLHATPTGQMATCWVVGNDGTFYVSNAASASVSRMQSGPGGALTLLGNTTTNAGTVDAAVSANGRYLYVQTGAAGTVDAFRIGPNGSLTAIGSVIVPGAVGGEGIVAV